MASITFFRDCFNVLLKEPRLTPAFISRNLAFSSYFSVFPDMFWAKMSIRRVSTCIFVKLLFFVSIFIIGSFVKRIIQFWTFSLSCVLFTQATCEMDTVLYTSSIKDFWRDFFIRIKTSYRIEEMLSEDLHRTNMGVFELREVLAKKQRMACLSYDPENEILMTNGGASNIFSFTFPIKSS